MKIGILGGGQLGRMMLPYEKKLGVELFFLDPNPNSPCLQLKENETVGDFNNYDDVMRFATDKDIISVEIEHVNLQALYDLKAQGKKVFPQPEVLEIIKDKGVQKTWYEKNGIPTAEYYLTDDKNDIRYDFPFVQKMRKGGYDGKGVTVVKNAADTAEMFEAPSVMEKMVDFEKEVSVIVARNESGEVITFPLVAMEFDHSSNLVSYLYSPSGYDDAMENKAADIARDIIQKLDMVGLLAVEFFITKTGDLLVNEMAPRPHNSGHHTIEACTTSQFEQFLRAISGKELGSTNLNTPAIMVNLVGELGYTGNVIYKGIEDYEEHGNVFFHDYGKGTTKPNRKMGHVTITHPEIEKAIETALSLKEKVKVVAS